MRNASGSDVSQDDGRGQRLFPYSVEGDCSRPWKYSRSMPESSTGVLQGNFPSISPPEMSAIDTRKELFVLDRECHPRGLQFRIQDAAEPTCEGPSSALYSTCTLRTSGGRWACAESGIAVPILGRRR